MDPRHPEEAVKRLRELMKQYDKIEGDLAKATTSSQIGQLEREGSLVIQEICLVAPRMHEAMMQISRKRRRDLAHEVVNLGIRVKYEQPFESQGKLEELGNGLVKGAIGLEEKTAEESFHRADVVTEVEDPYKVEEPKPKKKTTKRAKK